jgi:hypothetical protein
MVRSHALLTLAASAFVALSGTARADENSAQAFVDRLSSSAAAPSVTVSVIASENPAQAFVDRFSAPSHPVATEVANSTASTPSDALIARLSSSPASQSDDASSVQLAAR